MGLANQTPQACGDADAEISGEGNEARHTDASGYGLTCHLFVYQVRWLTRIRPDIGQCFGNPNPYSLSEKYGMWETATNWKKGNDPHPQDRIQCLDFTKDPRRLLRQYTSNLYGSTPPICIAILSWLLGFEARETLQYTSHLYCSTPPICTAVRPPICTAVLLEKYWGLGSPERFWDITMLGANLSIRFFFGGAWFRN